MKRIFSLSALAALPLALAAAAAPASASSPAPYCTFLTPASVTCPADGQQTVQHQPAKVVPRIASADHCVFATPASTACPAGATAQTFANNSAPQNQAVTASGN